VIDSLLELYPKLEALGGECVYGGRKYNYSNPLCMPQNCVA